MLFWAPEQLLHQLFCWRVATMAVLLCHHRLTSKQMIKQTLVCSDIQDKPHLLSINLLNIIIVQKLEVQQPIAGQTAYYLLMPAQLLLVTLLIALVLLVVALLLVETMERHLPAVVHRPQAQGQGHLLEG